MKTILVTEPEYFDDESLKILRGAGNVIAQRFTRKELERKISKADALLVRVETQVDKALLSKTEKLKVIGSATTGLNHIAVGFAKKRNIQVINLHGTHASSN